MKFKIVPKPEPCEEEKSIRCPDCGTQIGKRRKDHIELLCKHRSHGKTCNTLVRVEI